MCVSVCVCGGGEREREREREGQGDFHKIMAGTSDKDHKRSMLR